MSTTRCGVPQCHSRTKLYRIPKEVVDSNERLTTWMNVLGMEQLLPKYFRICSLHFASRMILTPVAGANPRANSRLSNAAFPINNLPKTNRSDKLYPSTSSTASDSQTQLSASCPSNVNAFPEPPPSKKSVGAVVEAHNIGLQVDRYFFVNFTSLWDTEKKLNTMTGIPDLLTLHYLVDACEKESPSTKSLMSANDRVLLTMYKLKSNPSFAELAISFQVSDKTAKLYFADTLHCLSELVRDCIHWPTKEETLASLPACFESFPNTRVIIGCTEIPTVRFGCLTCRKSNYSQYKGGHTLKVLIGLAPSGSVNYVSKVANCRSSGKAIFNLTDLLNKLEPGDAVMVDKGFLIGDDLSKAGIEIIRPEFHYQGYSRADVEKTTKIAAARVHVERKIARLKTYKVLSEEVGISMIPYMDEVLTLLCGISNLNTPTLHDDKFKNNMV